MRDGFGLVSFVLGTGGGVWHRVLIFYVYRINININVYLTILSTIPYLEEVTI